jgi:fibronectin type 3 domain-containing protein
MKKLSSILFLILTVVSSKAQDTAFLVGSAKHLGDSVIVRWNAEDPLSFHHLMNSKVIIEKKNEDNDPFKYYQTIVFKNTDQWIIQKQSEKAKIIALASILRLKEFYNKATDNLISQLDEAENANFYFSNASLYADLSADVANSMGLRFCDKNPNGQQVSYKIYLKGEGFISDTVYIEAYAQSEKNRKQISTQATEEFEQGIQLSWKSDPQISAYNVQRWNKKNNRFETLNQAPIVFQSNTPLLYFKDSIGNYQLHQYRILGMDLFADTFAESKTISAYGRDKTPPGLLSGLKAYEQGNQLILTWDKIQNQSDVKFVVVGLRHHKTENHNPLHEKALTPGVYQVEIPINKSKNDYYFLIQVYDTAGNFSRNEYYYQLNDVSAPDQPIGLNAKVDSMGVVTLKWKSNKELDLGGYLIYTSNSKNHEFSGLMNVPYKDTIFYDTLSLKMLNRDVFYRVVAVDNKMNRSKTSETVKVLRPDTLKPVSPIIKDYWITDTSISIFWQASSSLDVKEHRLIKKNLSNQKIITSILSIKDSIYIDKKTDPNQQYEYSLCAIDENGNQSPYSNTFIAQTYKNEREAFKQIFVALYDSTNSSVHLQWNQPDKKIAGIVLYKGADRNQLSATPYKIPANSLQYSDSKIKHNTVYFYAIQFYYTDGSKSAISEALGVVVN